MIRCLLFTLCISLSSPAQAFDFGALGDALGLDPKVTRQLEQAGQIVAAITPVSDEEEKVLGRDVAARVAGRFGIEKDATRTYYLNLIGTALAQRSDRPNLGYHFAILATDDINAYACPGGYIFVTRGAMHMVKDEAELAAMLAHEISHVTERHIIKALQQSRLMKVGSEVASDAFGGRNAELFRQMSDFATDALFKGLSKQDEYTSDRKALDYLNRLGYDYPAMYDVLQLLEARRAKGQTRVLARTHPSPKSRIQELRHSEASLALDIRTGIRLPQRFARYTQTRQKPS